MSPRSSAATSAASRQPSMPALKPQAKSASWSPSTSSRARIPICSKASAHNKKFSRDPKGARLKIMFILAANLGSTSFKYKLLNMEAYGAEVARGAYERIGQKDSPYATHADVLAAILQPLPHPPDAIGFKAVHGGPISGAVRVSDEVIATMEQFSDVAPAHNPPNFAAMKALREKLPDTPQVAAFETAFHQTIPAARQTYAIPHEWTEKLGIRRYGFHGASHRYAAIRVAELAGVKAKRIINCHLGGSSSICAIEDRKSVASS